MTRQRIIGIVVIVVLALAGAAAVIYFSSDAAARQELEARFEGGAGGPAGRLLVSGFIEADEVELSPEVGGRVIERPYNEGDEVNAGDVVLRLNGAQLEAARDAARARLDIAMAERDLLEASPRPEIIAQAQAQVALAQAAVDAASVAVASAASLANEPQDIELQVVDARTQLAVASEQLVAAEVQFTSADRALEMYYFSLDELKNIEYAALHPHRHGFGEVDLDLSLPLSSTLSPQRYDQALASLNSARESVQGAQELLTTLENFRDNPAALLAQVADASARLQSSQASLERAQADLAALRSGASPEDLAIADARIAEAQAAVAAIDEQIARLTLRSPIGAIVLEETVHVGELAVPGTPVITLANLDRVELTVYLPADQLNRVRLDQDVIVTVDSFPDREFDGVVVHIADEAEFTPRGVQTREERVNLVFAVRIRLDNPDHALKPGMPADAHFQ